VVRAAPAVVEGFFDGGRGVGELGVLAGDVRERLADLFVTEPLLLEVLFTNCAASRPLRSGLNATDEPSGQVTTASQICNTVRDSGQTPADRL
jgi:hypothetical protein